jgi:two-component system response regulator AtoC
MSPAPATVAIVDDDPGFARYLGTLLGARGYRAPAYATGTAFLAALEADEPPDVVLLDVLMPGMDGMATLRALRARWPGLQVIMLSGTQAARTIVDAVHLGAVDYVVKPDDPDGVGEAALEAAIRSAVEKAELAHEVARLKAQVSDELEGGEASWGSNPAMRAVVTMIDRVADSDVNVLISGESGVGKEIIARQLHRRSPWRNGPFVKVNCAALPADLLESELFGHERGAFTGASQGRPGRFEFAAGGTILLDEIGEMPRSLQPKILHVLQDRAVARLGSNRVVPVDARVLAATNQNLESMLAAGTFREDLYYRLQVIEIRVPPLRERPDEILPLAEFFLQRYARRFCRPMLRPSPAFRAALRIHPWPGNVRQLENIMKRLVILQDEALVLGELQQQRAEIEAARLPARFAVTASPTVPTPSGRPEDAGSLLDIGRRAAADAERQAILLTLETFQWNRRRTAAHLGISYKTLLNKLREYGLTTSGDAPDVGRPVP